MTKKRLILLALVLATLASFYSCKYIPFLNKKEPEPETLEEIDSNFPVEVQGVSIELHPERVVVLSGSMLEQLFDLGLGAAVVGAPDYTAYPENATNLPSCGTALIPNIEEIEALKTDLLITSSPLSSSDLERLESNGIVVLLLDDPATLDELISNYQSLALALEGKEAGAEIGAELTEKISQVFDELKQAIPAEEAATVLYIRQLPLNLATGDSLVGNLLNQLGFLNPAYDHTDWLYPKEELETAESKEAFKSVDILFFGEPDVTIKMLEESSIYKALPATANDKYLLISYDAMEKQGLRMFEQLYAMTAAVYPDSEIPSWSLESNLQQETPEEPSTAEDSADVAG